ncbi:inactive polyglycylase TTLL10 [Heteronotia binoei]|uniref:inactive polyglycylase TTLL10 n=1 Tax=Heteronotia binoei TaxID=13085 RepID=UPI00292E44B5|nr:inactive polyglycylase TTLL10 [Heteronotia binoei]
MAHLQAPYTKALLGRLGYAEQSHCPEHKWASARQFPGRKSIFSPLIKQDEPAEKDTDAQRSPLEPQLGNEKMLLKVQNVEERAGNSGLGTSKQMEALDLPSFPRADSGLSKTNDWSTDHMTEASQGQHQFLPASPFVKTGSVESSDASFEGNVAQEWGSKEGPLELEPVVRCQEAHVGVTPSEPIQDSVNTARKSCSTSKVDSKGVLAGVKRNKKDKAGTQRGNQHPEGPPSADAGESLHLQLPHWDDFLCQPSQKDANSVESGAKGGQWEGRRNRGMNVVLAHCWLPEDKMADGKPLAEIGMCLDFTVESCLLAARDHGSSRQGEALSDGLAFLGMTRVAHIVWPPHYELSQAASRGPMASKREDSPPTPLTQQVCRKRLFCFPPLLILRRPTCFSGWTAERSLESCGKAAALLLGFQWNPPYCKAGASNLAEGEPTHETEPKGNKTALKALPRMNPPEEKKPEEPPGSGPFFYIGGANGVDIVSLYCKNKGWQRIYDNRREDYILKWCETKFRDTYYNFREGEQLLYQLPNNKLLTTKIGLLVNLREYERVMSKISRNSKLLRMEEFFPETFRLDTKDERELFFEVYREPHIWICKPTGWNQGRGIFLLKNQEEIKSLQLKLQAIEEDPVYKKLPYRIPQAMIVQRYIDRPLLLEGKKFDVRSYLLIACTFPYMLFFGHGYVRLTCLNYNPMSEDLTSHLTNQYVQKKHPIYSHVKEETVWRMERFNAYVNERFRHSKGLPKDWVFNQFTKRMKEIMLHCFLAVKSKLDCKLGYFDLIGCDFLIDEDFKVWLLEMNSNPALHTNCSALKSIIPVVVNETLDLAFEIFTKSQKNQPILPLESLSHFVLLYNGVTSDNGPPRTTKSRTSLRSLHGYRPPMESTANNTGTANSIGSSNRPPDWQLPKSMEKPPKTEPSGLPEGISHPPHKTIPRTTLPMPQIQISIVPNLSNCPSVKAVLRGNQVCNSGSQYIIQPIAESEKHPAGSTKAETSDEKAKSNPVAPLNSLKDKSYTAWLKHTFGSQGHAVGGNPAHVPLTSSQMVSLHLQSNLPPNVPAPQERARLPRQLMTHAKPPGDDGKTAAAAGSCSCGDSLPEDKKASHRGS